MPLIAAIVVFGCVLLALLIWRGRLGRQEPVELDETFDLDDLRAWLRGRLLALRTLVAGATLVAVVLAAAVARNPAGWPAALGVLVVLVLLVIAVAAASRRRTSG